jgi:hypothetical protein
MDRSVPPSSLAAPGFSSLLTHATESAITPATRQRQIAQCLRLSREIPTDMRGHA